MPDIWNDLNQSSRIHGFQGKGARPRAPGQVLVQKAVPVPCSPDPKRCPILRAQEQAEEKRPSPRQDPITRPT